MVQERSHTTYMYHSLHHAPPPPPGASSPFEDTRAPLGLTRPCGIPCQYI